MSFYPAYSAVFYNATMLHLHKLNADKLLQVKCSFCAQYVSVHITYTLMEKDLQICLIWAVKYLQEERLHSGGNWGQKPRSCFLKPPEKIYLS